MKFNRFWTVLAAVLLVGTSVFAQTTASLTGRVTMDGNALPGVTVTISSPNLQGTRTTYTDVNGNYNFGALPPGEYTVRFEMESMQSVTKSTRIGVAQTGRVDAEMRLTTVAEAITVTATAPAVLETTEVQTNVQATLVDELPIARTLQATTTLAPGVNTNGPNPGAITISGALAADNLFLVNGAVVNENLRGQPHNLFIEDAIQETTVQVAGISAEFGRFTGGVVNALTKSGGNEFSGSFRDSLTNPSWSAKTPFPGQPDPLDELNEVYEGTLGGRIIHDRLWFFAAGRYFETSLQRFFTNSSLPFIATNEELRAEGKLTGQITSKHNFMLSYLDIDTTQNNNCFIECFEPSNLDVNRSLPNDFFVLRYNGILSNNFLLEASYTQKNFAFEGSGGDVRDRVGGTWGYDYGSTGGFFGAPVFCGVCDPEERNNSTYGAKATYYLASRSLGTHNIVAGYENWAEVRLANNYQSGSNFGVIVYTEPQRAADGTVLPIIDEGDLIGFFPIAQLSKGSDMVTDSFYVNNKWDLNSNWQFNVGLRFDKNSGKDSNGRTVADDSLWSPRLGVMWDILGNGRFRANASYSTYVNRIAETIGGASSPAGNPAGLYWLYLGPRISGVPSQEAFRQMFEWFDSIGGTDNRDLLVFASVPGVNTQIRESLVSPSVDEFTVGFGMQLGPSGYVRADYITRDWQDFFVTRADLSTGRVTDEFGNVYDLNLVENSDVLKRTYDAIQLQAAYRIGNRVNIGGNYTWSETKGNQTGQTGGSGPIADAILAYPELKAFEQHNPIGFLPQDQTHKIRAWVSYDQPTPIGRFNFSVLQNYDSGTPYSATASIDARSFLDPTLRAQYARLPSGVTYYFSDRGEFRFDDTTSTDVAINYNLPIFRVELFAQGELLNAFDEDAAVLGDTTVFTARNDPTLSRFNPFTETPIEGIHYRFGSNFGKPTAIGHYQLPRTYRFSVGLRF